MCKIKDCNLDNYDNSGYCILHCEKNEKNGWYSLETDGSKNWDKNKRKEFWIKIKDKIDSKTYELNKEHMKNLQKQSKEDKVQFLSYDFENVYFTPSIENTSPFYELNNGLNKDMKLSLNFKNCNFLGEIDFHYIFKAKDINFDNCCFHEDLEFKKNTFDNLFIFEDCQVYKKAEFRNIIFNGTTSFIETSFYGDLDLIHTKFEGLALFDGAKLGKLKIESTFFKDEASFLNIAQVDNKKKNQKKQIKRIIIS